MEKNIKKESWCDRNVPPMLQTWEEALSDLDESEKEFERGDVLTDEEFNAQCQALLPALAFTACGGDDDNDSSGCR